jgi:ring-1,2-phenylacetyl-CoA epoxidase subunit PaaD
MAMHANPTIAQVWAWLAEVPDPEIPVLSILDLGIVREVAWGEADGRAECVVSITPTYSGCPATEAIAEAIVALLHAHGVADVRLETRIAPAWTTDWLSDAAKDKLKAYGIAPPARGMQLSGADVAPPAQQVIAIGAIGRGRRADAIVECPRCGSTKTQCTTPFGSTPCKAMYRCLDCLEPFDYFKCH